MSTLEEQISQLETAITAQETLRPTIGDAAVEACIAALRAQVAALRARQQAETLPSGQVTPKQLLERLRSYLPQGLADKMRALGRIEGERKQATVVFADLSGFTALSERLDPEEVTMLTNEVLKEMAEAVYQYEGYVDKFIGDAVMAVFGAPVAHEDDPERALRAAVAMRERLEHFNQAWSERHGQPLSLHVGVNTGTVIAGAVGSDLRMSYTVMGDTVNTASRLEGVARPGQILVSRDTYRLARGAFTFTALDPITVKGKRKPLEVYELQLARLRPGKPRGIQELASVFVGRERESALLRRVAKDLAGGRGRIVVVVGEAGIGKSRLMAEWRNEIADRIEWMEGRCFAHTTALSYGPFLDVLRRYAGIEGDHSEAEALTHLLAAVAGPFPGDTEAYALLANLLALPPPADGSALLAGLPAEAIRQKLFDLMADLFTHLAQERPTLLVIEDAHWADVTSLELIERLLALTDRLPLAIIGVMRNGLGSEAPLSRLLACAQAGHADRFISITLALLSPTSSQELVERLLEMTELPTVLRPLILDKAEGNPFFVEEVIRALIEQGALARGETGWETTPLLTGVSVPDTLQGVLMSRLDRLPVETKWLAQQASVIGRTFLYRVLLRMAEDAASVDADLDRLEREQLIRERARHPEVEYTFKHALTQEVAYQSLLAPRRKELHRRVGGVMEAIFAERLGEFYSIIGEHFLHGEVWERAADYLTNAGNAAARLYAHAEARMHYARTLEALSHLPDTADNRRRRTDATINLVSVSFAADPPDRNLARLAEVERLVGELLSSDQVGGDDRLRLARIHFWMGRLHYYQGAMGKALGYYQQVLTEAKDAGDEELLAIPAGVIGRVLMVRGQFGQAGPLLAQAAAFLKKTANRTEWVYTIGFLGGSKALKGQYAEGVSQIEHALAQAVEMNYLTGIAVNHIFLCIICLQGGELARVIEESRAVVKVATQSRDWMYVYMAHGFRAWAESRLGNHPAAVESMTQARTIGQELGQRLFFTDWFAAADAEIAFNAKRLEEALTLVEKSLTLARATGGGYAEGVAHRVWGQTLANLPECQWNEVEAHLAQSLHLFEAGEAGLEIPRTHVVWGSICRDRGDMDTARSHWEKAAAQWEAGGVTWEMKKVRMLLASLSNG